VPFYLLSIFKEPTFNVSTTVHQLICGCLIDAPCGHNETLLPNGAKWPPVTYMKNKRAKSDECTRTIFFFHSNEPILCVFSKHEKETEDSNNPPAENSPRAYRFLKCFGLVQIQSEGLQII